MRHVVGVALLTGFAVFGMVVGWAHLAGNFRQAAPLLFLGWVTGLAGLALLTGAPRVGPVFRAGLVLAAVGLALLWVPTDGQGIMTGLRVGYAGALLAAAPRLVRVLRTARARREPPAMGAANSRDVLG
ncbi:MAG: hypothetical protein M0Z53_14850 [Thermaerobacter sp.]|nr:hypothetical protein [Thermaerobacter sp.]